MSHVAGQFGRANLASFVALGHLGMVHSACRGRSAGNGGLHWDFETDSGSTGTFFRAGDLPLAPQREDCGPANGVAFFFLRNPRLNVCQDPGKDFAQLSHRASVTASLMGTTHHSGVRKCPPSHRNTERVSCLL